MVLLDSHQRVFLIRSVDPADPSKPPWWETPGGGIDPGESTADTVLRELHEEAGIAGVEVGPVVWVCHSRFTFGGFDFDQHERIHVAWAGDGASEIGAQHLESLEALAFTGSRWWPAQELLSSDEPTVPPRLREFLPDLLTGQLPDEPVDITPLEGDPT